MTELPPPTANGKRYLADVARPRRSCYAYRRRSRSRPERWRLAICIHLRHLRIKLFVNRQATANPGSAADSS
jgi:hypothetical protein